jgi:hypothetical protein
VITSADFTPTSTGSLNVTLDAMTAAGTGAVALAAVAAFTLAAMTVVGTGAAAIDAGRHDAERQRHG